MSRISLKFRALRIKAALLALLIHHSFVEAADGEEPSLMEDSVQPLLQRAMVDSLGSIQVPSTPRPAINKLSKFLREIEWETKDLQDHRHSIDIIMLQKILNLEIGCSFPRWVSIDHFFEKFVYYPVLNRGGINYTDQYKKSCCRWFWIHGRAIPLKSRRTREKAVAIRAFREGLTDGVLQGINISLLGLLGYQIATYATSTIHPTAVNI